MLDLQLTSEPGGMMQSYCRPFTVDVTLFDKTKLLQSLQLLAPQELILIFEEVFTQLRLLTEDIFTLYTLE